MINFNLFRKSQAYRRLKYRTAFRACMWAVQTSNLVGIWDGFNATSYLYPDMPAFSDGRLLGLPPIAAEKGGEIGMWNAVQLINNNLGGCSENLIAGTFYRTATKIFGRKVTDVIEVANTVISTPGRIAGGMTFGFAEGLYSLGTGGAPVENLAKCSRQFAFDRHLKIN